MGLRVFIGLAIIIYEPLYHALQMISKCLIFGGVFEHKHSVVRKPQRDAYNQMNKDLQNNYHPIETLWEIWLLNLPNAPHWWKETYIYTELSVCLN